MSRKLWQHQQYALDKYKGREFFGLLFDCGIGKSCSAISIAEEKERPVVIIAPNVLCEQWKEEIEKYKEKDWNIKVITSKTKKKKGFQEEFEDFCKE